MTVYLAHATSFCSGVWRPVVERLGEDVVGWDFAGHGSGPTLGTPVDWAVFGDQVLDETEPGGIGVGHSMGGTALVMAQLADPGRFKALVLIEPIIFPGPHQRLDHPLSAVALKRRALFGSRAQAIRHFASRDAFSGWQRDAIEGYVDCGFLGAGPITLACRPEIEAEIYRGSNDHDTWERMGEIAVPVVVLSGEESDTIRPELTRIQASRFAHAGFEIVPGAGHFLPMERPDLVAERILRLSTAV